MPAGLNDINSIFVIALRHLLKDLPRGSKRQLAERIGVSTGHFSDILNARRGSSEEQRRRLAEVLGYPGAAYEDFLGLGLSLMAGEEPGPADGPRHPDEKSLAPTGLDPHLAFYPGSEDLRERGFLTIPFSQEMKLAAGGGGTIPITDDEDSSPVIVHGPSLGLRSAKNLQAFRVGGDSMEPLIAQNGIVLADLSRNDLQHLQEGAIYVLCWDRDEGECAVKRLRWAEKGRLLLIESEDRFYPPVVKHSQDIVLIGQVIWAWREFKYR